MDLQFPIKRILPKHDFQNKMKELGFDPFVERILVNFELLNSQRESIFSSNAIFDTGALFSLLPGSILNEFEDIKTIPHTVYGIIDTEECTLDCKLAKVEVRFKDSKNKVSGPIPILVAFSQRENVPYLIGMKGILSNKNISGIMNEKFFILKIKD